MTVDLAILHGDPARGGAERYTTDLAAALAARGHTVRLLATTHPPPPPPRAADERFERVTVPSPGLTRVGRYESFATGVRRLRTAKVLHAMLPLAGADLYHPHAGLAITAQAGLPWHRRWNLRRRKFASVERAMLNRRPGGGGPMVLCLSRRLADECRRLYPDARAEVLFNAVDIARFDPALYPPRTASAHMRLLMVAQDFARKGLGPTLAAMVRLPTARLTVVGRDDAAPYIALARRLGVADRVTFAGATDPRPYYAASDLFVMPTRHDPCSLVVLEALAMGLPVISTAANGACEIMTDGVHGAVLRDPQDVGGIAAAVESFTELAPRQSAVSACLALRPQLATAQHVACVEALYLSQLAI